MWKKIAIGCFSFTVLFLILLGGAAYKLWNISGLKRPASLNTLGVKTNTGYISKPSIISIKDVYYVTDMATDAKGNIVVAGLLGAAVINPDLLVPMSGIRWQDFDVNSVSIVKTRTDDLHFLACGSEESGVILLDARGQIECKFKYNSDMGKIAAGGVNGDNKLEFAAALGDGGDLHLFDHSGNEIWDQTHRKAWHVEMEDINKDGKMEIINSDSAGEIVVRDAAGTIIKQNKPAISLYDFSLCAWPARTSNRLILSPRNQGIIVFDYDGNTIASLPAPDCTRLADMRGIWVKLYPGENDYFAALAHFIQWDRSILYIYSPDNKLVYQEVLPEYCISMNTAVDKKTKSEFLLIGGLDEVLQYSVTTGNE